MNRTVLVVDDDEPLRESLCEALADEGYTAVGMENGEAALRYLRSSSVRPCMIFLDLMMPVMNGWQFRAEQKRDPALSEIPVVVITAGGRIDPKSIDAHLIAWKPLKLDTLLDAAQRFCPC